LLGSDIHIYVNFIPQVRGFHKVDFVNDFNRRVFRLFGFAHFAVDRMGSGVFALMLEALTSRMRPDDRGSLSHPQPTSF
jgi:hypothetical protein